MDTSKMEHQVNEMWAFLGNDKIIVQVMRFLARNSPGTTLIMIEQSDASLVKMCLNYLVAKHAYEQTINEQLQKDHDDPPYTKKPE